jgi:hypothetical protein
MRQIANLLADAGCRFLELDWRVRPAGTVPVIDFYDGVGEAARPLGSATVSELGLPDSIAAARERPGEGPQPRLPDGLQKTLHAAFGQEKGASRTHLVSFRQLDGYLAMMPWEGLLLDQGIGRFHRCPYHLMPVTRMGKRRIAFILAPSPWPSRESPAWWLSAFEWWLGWNQSVFPPPERADAEAVVFSLGEHVEAVFSLLARLPFRHVLRARLPEAATFFRGERAELETPADRLKNPWLRWVSATLADSAVDTVCFVCPGRVLLERGALYLPLPARGGVRDAFAFADVTAEELDTFLTHVGAAQSFYLPAVNAQPTGYALRLVVDRLRQLRPGTHFAGEELVGEQRLTEREAADLQGISNRLTSILEDAGLADLLGNQELPGLEQPRWRVAVQRQMEKLAARLIQLGLERGARPTAPRALLDTERGLRQALQTLRDQLAHPSETSAGGHASSTGMSMT